MSFFNKIFKKKEPEVVKVVIPPAPEKEQEINLNLPEDQIVPFKGEILDTSSKENIAIFKHNLKVLQKRTKEKGHIEKFMLIREDDYFPVDWKWRVASCYTNMEELILGLSYAIKRKYALEKAGINNIMDGMEIPIDPKKMTEALSGVDMKTGFVYQPSHFRSTKHFTINTPLGVTGSYNSVKTERNFTIIDSVDNFMKSGYGYSAAYFDAYLDVSHEALDISPEAIVLIEKSKYNTFIKNPAFANVLSQRRVVVYEGDETLAINMLLTESGALPSQIGELYGSYDEEIMNIINASIIDLASQNNLLFNQSHAAYINPAEGHFSNHFDDLNHDHLAFIGDFVNFMKNKFPEQANLFTIATVGNSSQSAEIVNKIGTAALLNAIEEYNKVTLTKFNETYSAYKEDHDNIAPEDRNAIIQTIRLISETYRIDLEFETPEEKALLEEAIRRFFQLPTTAEQLEAAKIVWNILGPRLEAKRSESEELLTI